MPSSNLPPGVHEGMIPGNRPEEQDWEDLWAWIGTIDIDAHDLQLLVVGWCREKMRDFGTPPLDPPKGLACASSHRDDMEEPF